MDLIEEFARFISFIVEFGIWIVVALLLWILFSTRKRWLPYLSRRPGVERSSLPVIIAGGELTADSLPDDISGAAIRLWKRGRKRQALSLLYRGSVFAAVTQYGVRLPPSATEGICVSAVGAQTDDTRSNYFRRVVAEWIRCAYGSNEPDGAAVLPLCREWPQHFGKVA